MKRIKFHLRRGFNLILTLLFTAALLTLIMFLIYRPTYKISFKGKFIGYSRDVFNIKNKIHESIFNGDESVAYYEIDEKPTYEFTFMKAQFIPDDNKIIEEIKAEAVPIYKVYAIKENNKIKARVGTYKEATKVLADLKKKDSDNLDDITIELKYEKEKPTLTTTDKVVADLYKEKPKFVYSFIPSRNYAFIARGVPNMRKLELPVSLVTPVGGIILPGSNFGDSFAQGYPGTFHIGLDISGNNGKPFKAAAAGTVVSSGYSGSYGNIIEIDHGNGVSTVYAHASSLLVEKGDKVAAGQVIGKVGSTGFTTGPHLHFEVRYRLNGINYLLNPRHYISI